MTTTTTTYAIDDADGNLVTAGLQGDVVARRTAQKLANDTGHRLYLYEIPVRMDDNGETIGESEEFVPEADDARVR